MRSGLRSAFKIFFVLSLLGVASVWQSRIIFADIYYNVLAVNATDVPQEKEIKADLPKEVALEDILDTSGLKVDYNVDKEAYFVYGTVSLGPKETKTFKVRVQDKWKFTPEEIDGLKKQVNSGFDLVKGTEYEAIGTGRKETLLNRLDYIYQEQEKNADNVERRIDNYRTYVDEIEQIHSNSLSIKYWRTKPADIEEKTISLVIELVNEHDEPKISKDKHYLPSEVTPEHILDNAGFEVRYDGSKGLSYLYREEELGPKETKKYTVRIRNIWQIPPVDMENVKERARKAFKLLEKTQYVENAKYLVDSIKKHLDVIEASQQQERDIKEHISAFRLNETRFAKAKDDVRALEELLEAVRENLERSKLRNVLEKIKSLKSIADIAQAVFGTKPSANTAWKIIAGILIFVGIFTAVHFAIWGSRSKNVKLKNLKEEEKAPEKK